MKLKWIAVCFGVLFLAAQVGAEEAPALKTQKDKVNYGIGVSMGKSIQRQGIEVDVDMVVKGMKDTLAGGKLLMSEEELRKTLSEFQKELQEKQVKARTAAGAGKQESRRRLFGREQEERGSSDPQRRAAIQDTHGR